MRIKAVRGVKFEIARSGRNLQAMKPFCGMLRGLLCDLEGYGGVTGRKNNVLVREAQRTGFIRLWFNDEGKRNSFFRNCQALRYHPIVRSLSKIRR